MIVRRSISSSLRRRFEIPSRRQSSASRCSRPDPVHTTIRELVALGNRPREMLSYLEGTSEGRRMLENTGGIHALLYRLASESTLGAKDLELLETIIANTVAIYFKTWTTEPAIQVRMIEQTDWRGRYVGFWHLHPPRTTGAGFQEGIEPSVADMRNAVELGQFLTIVFQPDGFDFYDLSRLAFLRREDLSEVERISYRFENWNLIFSRGCEWPKARAPRRQPRSSAQKRPALGHAA